MLSKSELYYLEARISGLTLARKSVLSFQLGFYNTVNIVEVKEKENALFVPEEKVSGEMSVFAL